MNIKIKKVFVSIRTMILFLIVMLSPVFAGAQTNVMNLPGPSGVPFVYNFLVGAAIPAGTAKITVSTAITPVTWDWAAALPSPDATTASSFTKFGVTVQLPADAGVSTPSSGEIIISGPATATGSFSFSVVVADAADGTPAETATYEVIITRPSDIVMVLDRSGSMSLSTGSGSRWDALRSAATNFLLFYQGLSKPNDRLSITYFESDLLPASANFNTFVSIVTPIATNVNTEIGANSPGGSTGMGNGLKNAETKLSDATRARSILLLTDGEQNVPLPSVNTNGLTYSDGSSVSGGSGTGGIKIATIGIASPGATLNTTLQNLASTHRGSYNTTSDGAAFTFVPGGDADGDLTGGFTSSFVSMLSEFSPQIIANSSNAIPANNTPVTLQTFPLNKKVDKLLLQFIVGKNFEIQQLFQVLARIQVQKDGVSVLKYARPSWAGNFTNTIMLTFDFKNPPSGLPAIDPAGKWTVQIADSILKFNYCKLISIADDHRLHIQRTFGNTNPKVNDAFPLSVKLDWLSYPIKDAKVEALILRPGEDLGDILARNPFKAKLSDSADAGSPGLQKYNELWATDSAFRESLKKSENLVTLSHTQDGKYEGTFNGLTVSGVYRIIFRISGTHAEAGEYQRYMSESFYTSFSGVDLSKSDVKTSIANGQLIMTLRPMTKYGRYIGPAAADAFTVNNPGIKISKVEDHQDGSYTITFTGNINDTTSLQLLGQTIYSGKLADISKAGKGKSIIGKIQSWLESMGLPAWSLWVILFLLLLIILLLLRRKK